MAHQVSSTLNKKKEKKTFLNYKEDKTIFEASDRMTNYLKKKKESDLYEISHLQR